MKKQAVLVATLATFTLAAPAFAVGVEDLAKVILGNGKVLKTAEAKCGTQGKLSMTETLTIDNAIAAVQKKLAPELFSSISTASQADADIASQTATFCPETKQKKKGLLSKIGKAAQKVVLGGIGL
jgi:hypothetical protein